MRTFDLSKEPIETMKELGKKPRNTVPIEWLSPEEKLEKFGKKGVYMADYTTQKLPNNLFFYVDMTDKCESIMANYAPSDIIFIDENKIITPLQDL